MNIPVLRFTGDSYAEMMGTIFTENLHDIIAKVDDGTGSYEKGYFHTSTIPHEGTCYYDSSWSRDVGRGIIELSRLGFSAKAKDAAEYLLAHINHGDHWGRTADGVDNCLYETNGNALILLGIYNTWKINGKEKELGRSYLLRTAPVIDWAEREMEGNPHGSLLPCQSEMAGNPNSPYTVSAIYPNYAFLLALEGLQQMAEFCEEKETVRRLSALHEKLFQALSHLLVSGENPKAIGNTPFGCWMNGIDNRDGRAYDFSEWDGTVWPVFHWTRQLPFILQSDLGCFDIRKDSQSDVHQNSYRHILRYMNQGEYFRKYGFVSGSGWTGMGDRHDDTMCGYSQGFMTQAAMVIDDVNTYSRLLKGVARLAYDGEVAEALTYEMNPWVMHECFTYENFEKGLDHTFGTEKLGRPGVSDNPGDEGNLVQETEIVKALSLCAGVDDSIPGKLRLMPRLPWTWNSITAEHFPYVEQNGNVIELNFTLRHDRPARKSYFDLTASQEIKNCDIRIGPFPAMLQIFGRQDYEIEQKENSSWIWLRNRSGKEIHEEIDLW